MKILDVCGLSCPEPVIRVEKLVKSGENELKIILDTKSSVENVERYLKSKKFNITKEKESNKFIIVAKI
ncbi:MAG: sulfurtransferase TusA family protein [Tissierellia bacterium]|nr:sulfurtransferase TusA family protein [Tissierellia bacterium]